MLKCSQSQEIPFQNLGELKISLGCMHTIYIMVNFERFSEKHSTLLVAYQKVCQCLCKMATADLPTKTTLPKS